MDRLELARKEAELLEAGTPYAAVTIVHSAGTARTEGKMLVLPDETIYLSLIHISEPTRPY